MHDVNNKNNNIMTIKYFLLIFSPRIYIWWWRQDIAHIIYSWIYNVKSCRKYFDKMCHAIYIYNEQTGVAILFKLWTLKKCEKKNDLLPFCYNLFFRISYICAKEHTWVSFCAKIFFYTSLKAYHLTFDSSFIYYWYIVQLCVVK